MLYFITGNKNKLTEAQEILGKNNITGLDIDLTEIQELDPHEVIKAKLLKAKKQHNGEFIVEDTSLYFEALENKLPGPLIKWFLNALGREGVAELVEKYDSNKAEAKAIIGYLDKNEEIHFFEGTVRGTITKPKGESGFGWDPIFIPEGHDKSFAEMTSDEKNKISHRKKSLEKLKAYLDNK